MPAIQSRPPNTAGGWICAAATYGTGEAEEGRESVALRHKLATLCAQCCLHPLDPFRDVKMTSVARGCYVQGVLIQAHRQASGRAVSECSYILKMEEAGSSRENEKTPVKRRRLEGIKKSDLNSQTKCVVVNVLNFLKGLADPGVLGTINFKKSQELTSKVCGLSLRSVQRCVQEQKLSPTCDFSSPRKRYSREKQLTVLSDFDCDLVRRTILEFYDHGEFPTAEKVRIKLQEKIEYKGSVREVIKPSIGDFFLRSVHAR
ncbi:hypothetical protein J6590_067644 [Homalodisca vitripennis]|nr:hypothetical protein J6590_067644 [Homalodisca vitripennis]